MQDDEEMTEAELAEVVFQVYKKLKEEDRQSPGKGNNVSKWAMSQRLKMMEN